jgi:hypothetical protein
MWLILTLDKENYQRRMKGRNLPICTFTISSS